MEEPSIRALYQSEEGGNFLHATGRKPYSLFLCSLRYVSDALLYILRYLHLYPLLQRHSANLSSSYSYYYCLSFTIMTGLTIVGPWKKDRSFRVLVDYLYQVTRQTGISANREEEKS